jgi:hypothetical protein
MIVGHPNKPYVFEVTSTFLLGTLYVMQRLCHIRYGFCGHTFCDVTHFVTLTFLQIDVSVQLRLKNRFLIDAVCRLHTKLPNGLTTHVGRQTLTQPLVTCNGDI